MVMNLRVLLMLTLAPGTLCQEIELGPPTIVTPCTSKARAAKDRYVFNCTFGKDVKELVAQGWSTTMYIHGYPKVEFIICLLDFRYDRCYTYQKSCSCVYQAKQIHVQVNYTLTTYLSGKLIGGYWKHDNITDGVVTKNYTLPEVRDVNAALLTLTIAGVVGSLPTTTSCSFTLTLGTSNLMQLCCSDMALPCYTQISFREAVVATNESPCVTYTPTVDGVTGTLHLLYSVCTQTEYTLGKNCTIQTGVVTTARVDGVYTPEHIGPTSDEYATGTKAPTTAQPSSEKSNTLKILFWATLLVLVLVVAICLLVTLSTILGRRREQAAAHESKRDNLPEAVEFEPSEGEKSEPSTKVGKSESIGSPSTVSEIESEV